MFCKKCGSTLRDNAKFCGSCGAVVEVADSQGNNVSYTTPVQKTPSYTAPVQRQQTPSYTAPVQRQQAPGHTVPVQQSKPDVTGAIKKASGAVTKATGAVTKAAGKIDVSGIVNKVPKKALPIIGGAAVIVLVLILLFSGVFAGAKGTVAKAFGKSLNAYVSIAEDMKLPDLAAIAESGKYNQELKFWFEDGADELDGLGFRFVMAYNQSGNEAAIVAAPFFEGTDLITAQMKFKGSKIYVGCPELMEKTYLMVDTKTIGQDMADKDVDDFEDLSFNMFDLIEQVQKASGLTKDQQKALEKGGSAFIKAIEVEKDGKDDIKINGKKLSCTVYNVVIPQEAVEDYLDVLEDVLKDMDSEAVLDILEEAGFPVDDMGLDMVADSADVYIDAIDSLRDLVDELGDIEIQVGINKGYVVSIQCELDAYDEPVNINVQLGGGDNYVDDIYFEMLDEDEYGYIITSTGNHAMKKGVFTDETVVSMVYYGDEREMISWEMNWEPKGKDGNFEWTLENYGDEFTFEGTLHTTKDSLSITLDELEIDGMTVGLSYTLGDYKAPSIKVGTTLAFADMDEDDMEDLAELIEENGEAWVEMMEDDYEDVLDYLYYMF